MGKVFTSEQIGAGDYPESTEAHIRAAHFLLEGVAELNTGRPNDALIAAMGYGTVALNEHTRRSDLDFVAVVPDDQEYEDGLTLTNLIAKAQVVERVPVEPEILSRTAARRGTHTRDSLFMEHLGAMAQQSPLIVSSPDWYFPPTGLRFPSLDAQIKAVEDTVWSYIERKKGHFARALSGDDAQPAQTLQRTFELPGSLARKLVRVAQLTSLRKDGHWDADALPSTTVASRAAMTAAATPLAGKAWQASAEWLTAQNDEYSTVLESTIAGATSLGAYDSWLRATTPEALRQAYQLSVASGRVLGELCLK